MKKELIATIYTVVLMVAVLNLIGSALIYKFLDTGLEKVDNKYVYKVNEVHFNFIRVMAIVLLVIVTVSFLRDCMDVLRKRDIPILKGSYMLLHILVIVSLIMILNKFTDSTGKVEMYESTYNYLKFGSILLLIVTSFEFLKIGRLGLEMFYFESGILFEKDTISTYSE